MIEGFDLKKRTLRTTGFRNTRMRVTTHHFFIIPIPLREDIPTAIQ